MENKRLDAMVFRLAIVIFLIGMLCLFITESDSRERIITYITLLVSGGTAFMAILKIRKK